MTSPDHMPKHPHIFLSAPHMSGRERELVAQAFDSNYIAPAGPMLKRFENDLVAVTGFEHIAALTSGTAALHLALRLLDIGANDTVWASTLTFIGGVGPILYQNATPIFFDVDQYGLIDFDLVELELKRANAANELPKAIILTDLYGLPCNIDRAREICAPYGIPIICDSAESLGSTIGSNPAGAGADFAVYSFNGNKIITTSGGGALGSNNSKHIAQAIKLSQQAKENVPHYEHKTVGYNYRLSNISAAIGVGQLEQLGNRVARKREIFETYKTELETHTGVTFLQEPPNTRSNRWLSVMFLDPEIHPGGPTRVLDALKRENIEARPVWKPMHLQPVFKSEKCIGGKAAENMFATGVCLPSGTAMTAVDQTRITTALTKALKQ